jgi:hypothetical protein
MNAKLAKRMRKGVRKEKTKLLKDFNNYINRQPFIMRFKTAWDILWAKS